MKRKIFITCFIFVLIAVSFYAGFSVTRSQAVVPLGFGGQLIAAVPCTCSGGLWLNYAPLKVPSSFPGGPLSYLPWAATTYKFYNMTTPGVWHLGLYEPGVQGCWEYAGFACIPIPSLGNIIMVGTSLTPAPVN